MLKILCWILNNSKLSKTNENHKMHVFWIYLKKKQLDMFW